MGNEEYFDVPSRLSAAVRRTAYIYSNYDALRSLGHTLPSRGQAAQAVEEARAEEHKYWATRT